MMGVYLVPLLATTAAAVAAYADLRTRRIPNWLTLGTAGVGLAVNLALGGVPGGLSALGGLGLGLALLLPFYALRAVGAGDVKLLAALGAVVGLPALVSVAFYAAVVGGLMSLVVLAGRGRLMLALNQLLVQRVIPTGSGATAPYGLAIASGVYLSLLLPSILS